MISTVSVAKVCPPYIVSAFFSCDEDFQNPLQLKILYCISKVFLDCLIRPLTCFCIMYYLLITTFS